ncbi:type II toxin-antitoxin system VapB family antitoxin [Deinococcus detaillensis]|uniref:Type II toxin-antitoxin system VapB family antitoxin n=1 Tax=Deinococcus detaillensis TaxID=2592048 RepID=A0A553URF1_9DEIO|nr:type II toxin-antitoxin system VapB family antitoxin [Deinococcus detaillensis]TSA82531.1 type II toxin-antitoxin system VapB family antitoxin [Deinococcus detaillensis]
MTTVQLPDELVRHLQTITGQEGADAAVLKALEDYIYQRQLRVLDFEGQFDADPPYDYKEQRRMDERKN